MVRQEGNRLIIQEGISQVWIECWGEDSLRVRMTAEPEMDKNEREKLLLGWQSAVKSCKTR